MPHTLRPTAAGTGLVPVPVAIILPPATTMHTRGEPGRPGRISDHTACQLSARYTHHGEQVIDLDANPAIAAAAGWLERRSLTLTDRDLAPADPHQQQSSPRPGSESARLVIATAPRPGAGSLGTLSEWMRQISSRLLAPGGFLLTVVTGTGNRRYTDHATTIITAAAAAGLSWHQHIIDVHTRLPEHEPRAEPETAAATTPRLVRGRHRRAHHDLLAFTNAGARTSMREPTLRHLASTAHHPAHRVQQSVWLTGQVCSRDQRRHRYPHASLAHPGKMLPSIARYAIATYTARPCHRRSASRRSASR